MFCDYQPFSRDLFGKIIKLCWARLKWPFLREDIIKLLIAKAFTKIAIWYAIFVGSCYCDSRFLGSAVALDRPLVAAIATVNFFCMYLGTQRLQFSTLRVHHRPWDANQCPAERTLRVVSLRETPLVWRCISCFKGNIIWHNLTLT